MSSKLDPQPPSRSDEIDTGASHGPGDSAVDGINFLALLARADEQSKQYQMRTVDKALAASYRAWQSQHAENSKYQGEAFRGRSRLFVPKTRAAVRKNLAAAAGALFSTEDVTNIGAMFEDDPQQRATASVIKADMEYRMSHGSSSFGIPWFLIAMGAALDGQLTGVCFSKQSWEFEERGTGKFEAVPVPVIDDMGQPILDEVGMPVVEIVEREIMRTVKDRPMSDLHPIENIGVDPAAPWHSVVQDGRWFFCRYPMGLSDARAMIKAGQEKRNGGWLPDVSDATLRKGRVDDERSGARRVRENGGDHYEEASSQSNDLDIVWLQENFFRIGGIDYHFWSVGKHAIISDVRQTWESYPEFGGQRPYVMGLSQLDTHKVFPQSPVESWQPLQLEMNDIANLRLDTLKRSIAPLPKVKRGKNVDLKALQRRGQPETMLLVDSLDDVEFVNVPGANGAAFQETSITNANFDELAGVFSTSSVQQSRQLNETVGGMSLMSRAANSVSEFDLRIWIETWVEPVLRQIVQLIRYHESDERLVAVAGQQARAFSRYGYMPTLDDFAQCEVTVRVNAGIGAADPIQKLQKLKFAFEMLGPMLPEAAAQGITPNVEALIEEVMGGAGFRDGRRFFEHGEPQQQGEDPKIALRKRELDIEEKRLDYEVKRWAGELLVKMEKIRSDERQSAADNDAAITSSEIEWQGRLAKDVMGMAQGTLRQATDLRAREAAASEQYRMQQMASNKPDIASSKDAITSLMTVIQALTGHMEQLSSKVSQQDQMLSGIFGRMPSDMPQGVQ